MKKLFKFEVSAIIELDSEKFIKVNPDCIYDDPDSPFYLPLKPDISSREFSDEVKRYFREWLDNCCPGKEWLEDGTQGRERSTMVSFINESKIFDHDHPSVADPVTVEAVMPKLKISVYDNKLPEGKKFGLAWDVEKYKTRHQIETEFNDKLDAIDEKLGVDTKCQK